MSKPQCESIGQNLQFVEHGGHVARHADLISLGVISLRPRLAAGLMVA